MTFIYGWLVLDVQEFPQAESVEQFLQLLDSLVTPGIDHWYRGHASDSWQLLSGVFRSVSSERYELMMLKRFMQDATRYLGDPPTSTWEWVMLAQHHHVPTRLMDWTENPLVALFFATSQHFDIVEDDRTATEGVVWVLKPTLLNDQSLSVDTGRDLPMLGLDEHLEKYSPFTTQAGRLPTVAAIASRTFARITSQWGTFTICNTGEALETSLSTSMLYGIRIPVTAKEPIRSQLAAIGVEDRTVFPELFRLGDRVREIYA